MSGRAHHRARAFLLSILVAGSLTLATVVPVAATGTLDQSQTTVTSAYGAEALTAQTFQAGISGTLDTISLNPAGSGGLGGATIELRTTAAGSPTTTVLASQLVTGSVTNTWVDIVFATPATVTAGQVYAIVIPPNRALGQSTGTVDAYTPGAHYVNDPSAGWIRNMPTGTYRDLAFRTYVTAADTTPPTFTSAFARVQGSKVTITFLATDGGSGVDRYECSLDSATPAWCTSPEVYPELAKGAHTWSVTAYDVAGNGGSTSVTFTIKSGKVKGV